MENKPKKCKAIGKAAGFISCGQLVYARKYGMCMNCYRSWLSESPEGQAFVRETYQKARNRVQAQIKRQKIAKRKKDLDAVKSISELKKDARTVFQRYIRLRDKDQPCISCGSLVAKFDAGHYFKAEVFSGVIFDEDNVHKQCSHCNRWLDGNLINYGHNLIDRIGSQEVYNLVQRAESSRMYKYSREELLGIKARYSAKIKELNNQE